MNTSLEDYRWLVSPEAEPWLEIVAQEFTLDVRLAARLRRDLTPRRAALILGQAELRRKAVSKFPRADRMFFLPVPLEQATDAVTAAYKAERIRQSGDVAGRPILDLCCGIGGDLFALAQIGPPTAVDLDPARLVLAEANCRALGLLANERSLEFREAPVEDLVTQLPPDAICHIDPDRRAQGRRGTRLEDHSPDRATLELILERTPDVAIKLAPATELPSAWHECSAGRKRCEAEWIGTPRECRQQVAWFGSLAQHGDRESSGQHRATVLRATPQPMDAAAPANSYRAVSIVGSPREKGPTAPGLLDFLYEPAPSVLAAGLVPALALQQGMRTLPGSAYLAGDRLVDTGLAAAFQVVEAIPFDEKRVKAWVREHDVGPLEIKKRGVDIDPAKWQARLHPQCRGKTPYVLFVLPLGDRTMAAFAQRVGSADSLES